MRFFWRQGRARSSILNSGDAKALVELLANLFSVAIDDLNANLAEASAKLSVSALFNTVGKSGLLARVAISNSQTTLSIRADDKELQAFLIPSQQFRLIPTTEYPSRLRFKLKKMEKIGWTLDGNAIAEDDLRLLVLASTNDIIKYAQSKIELPAHSRLRVGDLSLTTGLRDLIFQKAQLVSDLVSQQERFQSHLAEELHDGVIADLLFVRRALSSNGELNRTALCQSLDEIIRDLRDMCTDMSSSELKEWVLWDGIAMLRDRLTERSGIKIQLQATGEIPALPSDVSLNLYRMVQESLNNALKHAQASNITVSVESTEELVLTVQDDGKGFEPHSVSQNRLVHGGGMGISLLKERAERLTAMGYSAVVEIDSVASKGTKVRIQTDLTKAFEF